MRHERLAGLPTRRSEDGEAARPAAGLEPRPERLTGQGPRAELVALIPALRAFARGFCRSGADADDLVQETLLKGVANIHRYEPGTNMKSWLFTIMRNTFYTRIRIVTREGPAAADCVSATPVAQPPQEWRLRGQEIIRAVAELPDRQREVLILISVLGLSYLDTAEICDCAVGTVKSRLNRARARLVALLGETGDAPDDGTAAPAER
jgi:RNA polymerase sigma-70 factor (ECF subfamily)